MHHLQGRIVSKSNRHRRRMDNLRFSDIKSNVSINEWDKRRRRWRIHRKNIRKKMLLFILMCYKGVVSMLTRQLLLMILLRTCVQALRNPDTQLQCLSLDSTYVVAVTLSSYTTSASGCFSFLNHRLYTTTDFHFRFLVFIYGCHTILVGGFRVVYMRPQLQPYFQGSNLGELRALKK
ncbi:hypothetical protein GQX74_011507 [Glossina fuscipes]|nr:hypothetical protein GQX74_011507 [Glossina fuscipes]